MVIPWSQLWSSYRPENNSVAPALVLSPTTIQEKTEEKSCPPMSNNLTELSPGCVLWGGPWNQIHLLSALRGEHTKLFQTVDFWKSPVTGLSTLPATLHQQSCQYRDPGGDTTAPQDILKQSYSQLQPQQSWSGCSPVCPGNCWFMPWKPGCKSQSWL